MKTALKTAEELFDKHASRYYNTELPDTRNWNLEYDEFTKALTEDRQQIKDMIDGMINKARKEIEVSEDSGDIFADSYLVEQLTELKERINK